MANCIICGNHAKNKYCSRKCYGKDRSKGTYSNGSAHIYPCANCGTEVYGKGLSKNRDGSTSKVKFCNRSCYDKHRTKLILSRKTICSCCGSEFGYKPSQNDRKYCGEICAKLGKKAQPKNCLGCGCYFTPMKVVKSTGRLISANSGKTCSQECYILNIKTDPVRKDKIGKAFTGKLHPNWQGGGKSKDDRGFGWKKIAAKIRKRDDYTCRDCGVSEDLNGRALDVHHKIPFSQDSSKKANSSSNLVSLCRSCHIQADSAYRRENEYQLRLAL